MGTQALPVVRKPGERCSGVRDWISTLYPDAVPEKQKGPSGELGPDKRQNLEQS
jgi:hypothetical protein